MFSPAISSVSGQSGDGAVSCPPSRSESNYSPSCWCRRPCWLTGSQGRCNGANVVNWKCVTSPAWSVCHCVSTYSHRLELRDLNPFKTNYTSLHFFSVWILGQDNVRLKTNHVDILLEPLSFFSISGSAVSHHTQLCYFSQEQFTHLRWK